MRFRRAFTIVELLMVIGIIGVLTGIVTTAAAGALQSSRDRRATALCAIVQQGLAVYHAQKGEWPKLTSSKLASGRTNKEGFNNYNDATKFVLNGSEVRNSIKELVQQTKYGTPVMDVSGLYVSRMEGRYGQDCYGLDFMSAIHGTRKSSKKMKLSEMYFGYPDPSTGKFRHFKIVYTIPTDSMVVSKMDDNADKAKSYE